MTLQCSTNRLKQCATHCGKCRLWCENSVIVLDLGLVSDVTDDHAQSISCMQLQFVHSDIDNYIHRAHAQWISNRKILSTVRKMLLTVQGRKAYWTLLYCALVQLARAISHAFDDGLLFFLFKHFVAYSTGLVWNAKCGSTKMTTSKFLKCEIFKLRKPVQNSV